jgi:hypothetical protein
VKRQPVELLVDHIVVDTVGEESRREAQVKVRYRFAREPPGDRRTARESGPGAGRKSGFNQVSGSVASNIVNACRGARVVTQPPSAEEKGCMLNLVNWWSADNSDGRFRLARLARKQGKESLLLLRGYLRKLSSKGVVPREETANKPETHKIIEITSRDVRCFRQWDKAMDAQPFTWQSG